MLHTTFDTENSQAIVALKGSEDPDELLDILESNPLISNWTIKRDTDSKVSPEVFLHINQPEQEWEAYIAIETIGVRHLSNGPINAYHTIVGLVSMMCDRFASYRIALLSDLCRQRDSE